MLIDEALQVLGQTDRLQHGLSARPVCESQPGIAVLQLSNLGPPDEPVRDPCAAPSGTVSGSINRYAS